jgi:hypothetical protein
MKYYLTLIETGQRIVYSEDLHYLQKLAASLMANTWYIEGDA